MRWHALVLAILAVLALPSGAVASGPLAAVDGQQASTDVEAASAATADTFAQATTEPNAGASTEITVQLRENGDARWRVEMRYPLASANETAAFRRYGDAFESGETEGELEIEAFEYLAASSSTVANRQMRIQNISRSATVTDDTGVLQLSFTWTEFLSTDSEQLVLRDALRLPSGRTWLSTLEPNQRLVIETPPGYAVNSTNAPLVQRSNSIIIDGPRTFDTEEPLTIRYEQTTSVAGYPWEIVAGIGIALIVVIALVVRRWQDRTGAPEAGSGSEAPSGTAGGHGGEPAAESTGTAGEAEPTAGPESAAGPTAAPQTSLGGAATAGSAADAGETPDDAVDVGESAEPSQTGDTEPETDSATSEQRDLSLLSDEERVEHLLEHNGGRMRQAAIVEETGWSDAKVSQLLSAMADEDRIEKLRLGRENLISLPDEDEEEDEK